MEEIKKSKGSTISEKYLSKLCTKAFLSLWCYPNVYRDQGRKATIDGKIGVGKELCDLLVVFDNHILIFSDKDCEFKESGDLQVDWIRWYKKAVKKASEQIYGAERWIFEYPKTLYLDEQCKIPFPLSIPKKEEATIHRIVISHGSSNACKKHLGGSGSNMIMSHIVDNMHTCDGCTPFAIGNIDTSKGFVHVLDDITVEILIGILDTFTDFFDYLVKKEELFYSKKIVSISGEEELLANYLLNINEKEHCFIPEESKDVDGLVLCEGLWQGFCTHPSRLAQVEHNQVSYFWDYLLEKFADNIFNNKLHKTSEEDIESQSKLFTFLAKESRFKRRGLSSMLLGMFELTDKNKRMTRIIPAVEEGEPYYLFLLLPFTNLIPYDEYRRIRLELLEDYLMIVKLHNKDATDIIGIATESGDVQNRSEDVFYIDASEWNDELEIRAQELEREFRDNGLLSQREMIHKTIYEYPDDKQLKARRVSGADRNKPCPCGSGMKFKKCCWDKYN